jgi:hypothetical protein
MNELIEELIKQAQEDGDAIHYYNPAFAKKLVELTVKECASIYDKIDNGNLHMGTDNYLEALHKTFRS